MANASIWELDSDVISCSARLRVSNQLMDRTSVFSPVSFYRIMNINCYGGFFFNEKYTCTG